MVWSKKCRLIFFGAKGSTNKKRLKKFVHHITYEEIISIIDYHQKTSQVFPCPRGDENVFQAREDTETAVLIDKPLCVLATVEEVATLISVQD